VPLKVFQVCVREMSESELADDQATAGAKPA